MGYEYQPHLSSIHFNSLAIFKLMKDHVSKQLNDLCAQLPPSALFIPDKLEAY